MGRYYTGDIEGKFWFGVQGSTDAEYFGGQIFEPQEINYWFDEKDIKTVKKGLKTCKKRLGKNLKRLERYFEINYMYNDAKIMEFWKDNYKEDIHVQDQLEWYARYLLGSQIFSCVENKGSCSFSAEI